ncbi:hypothetical protein C0J52_18770 [Blattella germanica]|nr:hypothetical protein C0J52_18770 [Blattella germanica]
MSCGSGSITCRRCKVKVVSAVKCVVCGNTFHLSCTKLNNNVDNIVVETFKCCDKLSESDGNVNKITDSSFSGVEEEETGNEPQDDIEEHFLMQC